MHFSISIFSTVCGWAFTWNILSSHSQNFPLLYCKHLSTSSSTTYFVPVWRNTGLRQTWPQSHSKLILFLNGGGYFSVTSIIKSCIRDNEMYLLLNKEINFSQCDHATFRVIEMKIPSKCVNSYEEGNFVD